jgi:hypothetical protein
MLTPRSERPTKLSTASAPALDRAAVIEECAKVSVVPMNDEQRECAENGFGVLLTFESIWDLAQETSAAAIRALASATQPAVAWPKEDDLGDGHMIDVDPTSIAAADASIARAAAIDRVALLAEEQHYHPDFVAKIRKLAVTPTAD